jgi:predicted NBD/HSP70 family sugar kinase
MHRKPDGEGYLVNPRAFAEWRDVPLAERLSERLGMPVVLENNATAAAIGERWYGAGQEFRNFFYLYFGSGLGGGLIINGQRFEGHSGNAGEVGYLPFPGGGGEDPHSSYIGLHFNLTDLYARLRDTGAEARTPDDLDQLLVDGHPDLLAWIDRAGDALAPVLLAVEYLVDPEAVFFGGRLPDRVLRAMIDRVSERLPARRIRDEQKGPALLLATAGVEAASLGVATLPIYQFFAPALEVLLKSGKGREAPALNTRLAAAS